MKMSIKLNNFCNDYLPFRFGTGENICFLRVACHDGKAFVLCCPLPENNEAEETVSFNGMFDRIYIKFMETIKQAKNMENRPVLDISVEKNLFEKVLDNNMEERIDWEAFLYMRKNLFWIQCQPSNTGSFDDGNYCLVKFSVSGEPTWNYFPKEYLEKQFPGFDLHVDMDALRNCQSEARR